MSLLDDYDALQRRLLDLTKTFSGQPGEIDQLFAITAEIKLKREQIERALVSLASSRIGMAR